MYISGSNVKRHYFVWQYLSLHFFGAIVLLLELRTFTFVFYDFFFVLIEKQPKWKKEKKLNCLIILFMSPIGLAQSS